MSQRRNVRTAFILPAFLFLFSFPGDASASNIEFKLSGGLEQYKGTDLIRHLDGWNALLENAGADPDGRLGFGRREIELQGRIDLNLTRFLGIGLGLGYFRVGEDARVNYTTIAGPNTVRVQFKADVVPLTLDLILRLPLGTRIRLNASAGAGYNYCRISWQENRGPFEDRWSPGNKAVLGYQGGVSLDFELTKNMAVVLEAGGRRLEAKGLSGPRTFKGNVTPNTRIWIGRTLSGSLWVDQLAFTPLVPAADAEHSDWREAVIDLSAIGARAGLVLKF